MDAERVLRFLIENDNHKNRKFQKTDFTHNFHGRTNRIFVKKLLAIELHCLHIICIFFLDGQK